VPNRVAREEQPLDRLDLTANKIGPVHVIYPALTGEGLAVSVKEKAFDKKDIDLRGRLVNPAGIADNFTTHATMMATMMAGAGNSAPSGKGVAWKARLASSDYAELLPDDGAALTAAGVSVQNHSYGVGIENYYGLEAHEYDKSGFRHPQLVHVFSSGNAGSDTSKAGPYAGIAGYANLTGQFKMSKNTLSVGACDGSGQLILPSSRGPAYDGRVKPELVAFGADGTSDAAALVSGICLLLQQAYRDQQGTLPTAALIKAALFNSADDTGRPEVDFETGYGNTDALGAARIILEGRFFVDALGQGEERVYTVRVPTGGYRLKGTLAWHDPEAAPNAATALVNDLDLRLRHPASGTDWQPWVLNPYPHPDSLALPAKRGADHLNNVEQVSVTFPAAGVYEFRVRGHHIAQGPQAYSLAYEVEPPFTWVSPAGGSIVPAGEPVPIRWEWSQPDPSARLEYRMAIGDTWLPVGDPGASVQSSLTWTPPDTAGPVQLRLVTDDQVYLSDMFTVAPVLTPRVGYRCGNELMLFWPAAPGSSGYQLYRLGDAYLEPLLVTPNTVATLDLAGDTAGYFAVAPVFGNLTAARGTTLNYTLQGTGCYVVSFVPRQLVADTVLLDLEIATAYRLHSVRLERWENGRFEPVRTVAPVNALSMLFADPSPLPGHNLYRVRLENDRNELFYSREEEVFSPQRGKLLVFPNPVPQGQSLNVVGYGNGAAETRFRLYDGLGKLLLELWETAAIHTIPTHGLRKGTYLLESRTGNAPPAFSRIIVL
jgi:hypothetical protein